MADEKIIQIGKQKKVTSERPVPEPDEPQCFGRATILVEPAENGYVVKFMMPDETGEAYVEEVYVYQDREDALREIARHL